MTNQTDNEQALQEISQDLDDFCRSEHRDKILNSLAYIAKLAGQVAYAAVKGYRDAEGSDK